MYLRELTCVHRADTFVPPEDDTRTTLDVFDKRRSWPKAGFFCRKNTECKRRGLDLQTPLTREPVTAEMDLVDFGRAACGLYRFELARNNSMTDGPRRIHLDRDAHQRNRAYFACD